jgi:GTP-binding protein Era
MKSGIVSIVGRPNSGKSTLINSLVGRKISIVSPSPQTTRHRILGMVTETRGQAIFVDTPGIHRPEFRMNRRMQHTVIESLRDVDLVMLMVDGSVSFGSGESFVLEMVRQAAMPTLLLINKIDKIAKPKLLPVIQRYAEAGTFLELIPMSARTGENRSLLLDQVFAHLPEGELFYPAEQITDRSDRFLAAEFIREKILAFAREEIPYATAVMIRKFDDSKRNTKKNLIVLEADILVEKKSQQGIIIGKEGSQLRKIGTLARQDLEERLGCKFFLGLTVRTASRWRDDDRVLDDLEVGT